MQHPNLVSCHFLVLTLFFLFFGPNYFRIFFCYSLRAKWSSRQNLEWSWKSLMELLLRTRWFTSSRVMKLRLGMLSSHLTSWINNVQEIHGPEDIWSCCFLDGLQYWVQLKVEVLYSLVLQLVRSQILEINGEFCLLPMKSRMRSPLCLDFVVAFAFNIILALNLFCIKVEMSMLLQQNF